MSANMLPKTGPDFDSCNNKGTDQPVYERRLISAFIFSLPGKHNLVTCNIQNSVVFVSRQVCLSLTSDRFSRMEDHLIAILKPAYSKPCLKRPFINRHNKGFNGKW